MATAPNATSALSKVIRNPMFILLQNSRETRKKQHVQRELAR